MSKCTDVDINALSDSKLASIGRTDSCDVFDKIGVNSEFEVEACSKDLDGSACLDADTKSSFESC